MSQWVGIAFGLFTLVCALGVIFSRNIVLSALALILSFFGLAGLYALMGSTFLAALQILVYAGAIVVLFVFVIMLIDSDLLVEAFGGGFIAPLAGLVTWAFALLLLRTINNAGKALVKTPKMPDLRSISLSLFGEYLWPFEVLSVFVLVIIVRVYVLASAKEGVK